MLRGARPSDGPALDAVCLRTGDNGADATARFDDPRLIGAIWAAPYLAFEPGLATVIDVGDTESTAPGVGAAVDTAVDTAVDAADGIGGYVLGARDTASFEDRLERDWWPALRERHPLGSARPGSADEALVRRLHAPPRTPATVTRTHPSHLHIDLLPAWQSGGWGRRLIDHLLGQLRAAGSPGVHLEVATTNERAVGFYRHLGFEPLQPEPPTGEHRAGLVLGRRLR